MSKLDFVVEKIRELRSQGLNPTAIVVNPVGIRQMDEERYGAQIHARRVPPIEDCVVLITHSPISDFKIMLDFKFEEVKE